jgi:thiosulfate reductase cytochrome b subunit
VAREPRARVFLPAGFPGGLLFHGSHRVVEAQRRDWHGACGFGLAGIACCYQIFEPSVPLAQTKKHFRINRCNRVIRSCRCGLLVNRLAFRLKGGETTHVPDCFMSWRRYIDAT